MERLRLVKARDAVRVEQVGGKKHDIHSLAVNSDGDYHL